MRCSTTRFASSERRSTATGDPKPKPKRGRPVKRPLPEPIPDTPENIVRAVPATPDKRDDE